MTPSATHKSSAPLARYFNVLRYVGLAALLALALTPLVRDTAAHDDAFFTPKWAWIAIWTALGVAALAARTLAGRVATFPLNEVWVGSLLFALWHWVAVLWARSPSWGVDRAAQITWLTLALWLGTQLGLRRRALIRMAWLFVGVGVLTALWVLLDDVIQARFPQLIRVKPNLPDWRGFLSAGLGNTSHIGDLTALALIPALALFGEARTRLAKTLLFLAALILPAGLIVSFSVGSNFGLIAGALLMVGLVLVRDRGRWFARRAWRWGALAAAWATLIAFFVLPNPLSPHPKGIINEAFGSDRWKEGAPTRQAIWAQALEMIRLHPVKGVGTGNFTYVFPEMDSRLLWANPELRKYQGSFTNAAHNEILQQWAELGCVGLFLFLALNGLAFYSLLRGIQWSDRPTFLARVTLAGLLLAWLTQAQMNFSFQHPAGALTYYGILLAIVLEKRTRPGAPEFPSLTLDYGPLLVRIDVQTMTKPTALGFALQLPRALAIPLGVALLAGGLIWWTPSRLGPVIAQREYHRGFLAEKQMNIPEADRHFQRALKLHPNAQDVRSHYSDWLIKTGRPAEGLAQLDLVMRRLNSPELWERKARGLAALGRRDEAQQAWETYQNRSWFVRQMTGGAPLPYPVAALPAANQ